ncbi:D-alanine--poly(phosphoribitol) ligase subunit DltC [Secundilactobacillus hailunensis]|uniref:D-alanyl carrier protein n=1 Tax=Secundilactobacillus hailunensis TaxID=2559923 RepID=A0ABW1T8V2_9LACO|nr:D-alanine--poly(phosphoribitol) ligase subunit DltC [Secundilactobacillus hailunensis]
MNNTQKVLNILKELTGQDLSGQMDTNLYENSLLDSMATVQLVMELEEQFGISIPISEFNRSEWETPNKIISKVESLQ